MNAYTRARILLLGLLSFAAGLAPQAVAGQRSDSLPVVLTIPETFPDVDARVVLMREGDRDIVVLDASDAEPETLSVALMILRRAQNERPSVPRGRGYMIPITGYASRGELTQERRAWLQEVLDELKARPLSNVGNLGMGRWLRFQDR
jgi:hypothetical protein